MQGFRFGVAVRTLRSRSEFQKTARRFEAFGFDVLHVPDHLGAPAPFPALAAAAQVTTTMRLGTYVLNAGFYKPALLARDAADVNLLSDGRLELGLGAGYVEKEFTAAELPFPPARARIDHLDHITTYLKRRHSSIPILIAGNGDRVLTLAATKADMIGLTGSPLGKADGGDPLGERVRFVRAAAGDRFGELELNLAVTGSPSDGSGMPDLTMTRRYAPHLSDEQLLALPGVLSGTARDIAETVRGLQATYGLTSVTVQDNHAEYFAKVIEELR